MSRANSHSHALISTASPAHSRVAYASRPRARALFVGEGDFSFSLAYAKALGARAQGVTSTSYDDSRHECIEANARELVNTGATVMRGVDATSASALEETRDASDAEEGFDRVVFMFPHIDGKGRISRNRELLREYLRASQSVLAVNGIVEVALAKGQGGTKAKANAAYGNTWKAYECGAEEGMLLVDVAPFDDEAWRDAGYVSRGHWRGGDALERGFRTEEGEVHAFCREGERPEGVFCDNARAYARDCSIWCASKDDDSERVVKEAFGDALRGADVNIATTKIDEYLEPTRGALSRTYRVEFTSRTLALTGSRVNAFNDAARLALGDRLRGGLATTSA